MGATRLAISPGRAASIGRRIDVPGTCPDSHAQSYRKKVAIGSRLRPLGSLSGPGGYPGECSNPLGRRVGCGFQESFAIALRRDRRGDASPQSVRSSGAARREGAGFDRDAEPSRNWRSSSLRLGRVRGWGPNGDRSDPFSRCRVSRTVRVSKAPSVYHQLRVDLLTKVIPVDNILFASEMIGAVRGIDPETGHDYDETKRYVEATKNLTPEERHKVYEGNARRVCPRLDKALKAQGPMRRSR
jgi:hypothetical protein